MAAAGHLQADCVFAGVFMFLVGVDRPHGLIYRWRPTRLTDAAVERLAGAGGLGDREGVDGAGATAAP